MIRFVSLLAALSFSACAFAASAPVATVDFNRDVLPVLSEHCFQCHGPDEKARETKLRLDTREGLLRAHKPIVIAGKAVESELFKRLVTKSADDLMPPTKAKKDRKSTRLNSSHT